MKMSVLPLKSDRRPVVMRSAEALELWGRWTLWTAAGELVGFAVPALVMAAGTVGGWTDGIQTGAALAVGAFEGAVLGLAQWQALRDFLPSLGRRSWVLATASGAMTAYLLAMVAVALLGAATIPLWVVVVACVLIGTGFLLSIGVPQWLVLRRHLPRAGWWVLANAIAWPLGTAVPFVGLAMVPDGSSFWVWAVAGIVSGLLMGGVVGALTGLMLVRLWTNRTSRADQQPAHVPWL
jgi:hypothetical protein